MSNWEIAQRSIRRTTTTRSGHPDCLGTCYAVIHHAINLPALVSIAVPSFVVGMKVLRACRRRHQADPPDAERRAADAPSISTGPGRPIFISGCNRGGTSILSLLLGHHPEVHNVGTGPFHEGQHIWRQRFPDRSRHRWAVQPWLSSIRKTAEDATPELITFFRRTFATACSRGRILEKTPANAVRIPFINRLYPDCFIVHIARDGRHNVASLIARCVAPQDASRQWVGVHSTALPDLEALGKDRGLLVRYEDLLRTPMAVLMRICQHCELDDSPVSRAVLGEAIARHLEMPHNRWPALPLADRRRVLNLIGELQERMGYPVDE
ncbi:MAG: sulfotransferase [Armatimonadetes bacterium]|nr:sulfotransferase [Armatimonadota bacterium]